MCVCIPLAWVDNSSFVPRDHKMMVRVTLEVSLGSVRVIATSRLIVKLLGWLRILDEVELKVWLLGCCRVAVHSRRVTAREASSIGERLLFKLATFLSDARAFSEGRVF